MSLVARIPWNVEPLPGALLILIIVIILIHRD